MSQTLILICTLAALAGLSIGYFLGWLDSRVQPVVDVLLGAYKVHRDCKKSMDLWIAYVLSVERQA